MDPYTGRVITVVNPGLAVETAYQPCSVFKIVVAVAGLTEGVITPETRLQLRRRLLAVAGTRPHQPAPRAGPVVQSVLRGGGRAARLREGAAATPQLLGLGTPSGINLQRETAGRVPLFVGPPRVGHVSSHAKGIATSAVQLAVLLSATINGGIDLSSPR